MPRASPQALPLADLSRRMTLGENTAWELFHTQYGSTMFRILLASTNGDPHLASEALQRAYLRVARHVRICDDEATWISWLRTICRSALSDSRRREYSFWNLLRRQREQPPERFSELASPESSLFAKLDAAMARLEPEARALLESKYFQGDSVHTIAKTLNLSSKAIEYRLSRARAELRQLMSDPSLRG
jgi:RNA polymerase sigma-70 factor, ECF subfamily